MQFFDNLLEEIWKQSRVDVDVELEWPNRPSQIKKYCIPQYASHSDYVLQNLPKLSQRGTLLDNFGQGTSSSTADTIVY